MKHKNNENLCLGPGNMPSFEINHVGSIAALWKYDSIIEKVHMFILQYWNQKMFSLRFLTSS